MMGPVKLSTIRAAVREAFVKSDAELLAWFNQQLENRKPKPEAAQTEMDTLRLLRDALVREAQGAAPRRKSRQTNARSRK